jgi:hypothetical protein
MTKNLSFLFSILLLASCGKENKSKTNNQTDSIAITADTKPNLTEEQSTETDKALKQIIFKTDSVKKHLTPKNALALYLKFREETDELISKIDKENTYILDNFYTHVSEKTQKLSLPDSLKTKFRNLEKANIEFWEIGEGYIEIRPKANYYQKVFENKLPADYNEFVKLEAFENKDLIGADAGLSISFEELSVLVLNWENFLLKYPNSKLYAEVKENYKNLLNIYLFGLDNTPTYENNGDNTYELYDENKKEFERFTSKNPKSVASKIVLSLLEEFKNNSSSNEFHKKIDQEFLKYAITK